MKETNIKTTKAHTARKKKKHRKTPVIISVIAVAAIALIVTGIVVFSGSGARRLRGQLDLGNRYLSELQYTEAIAAFEEALEIDPKSAEAYTGLISAHLGAEDTEGATAAYSRAMEHLTGVELAGIEEALYASTFPGETVAQVITDGRARAGTGSGNSVEWTESVNSTDTTPHEAESGHTQDPGILVSSEVIWLTGEPYYIESWKLKFIPVILDNGTYQFIDLSGNLLGEYDDIDFVNDHSFSEPGMLRLLVEKDGKYGYVDATGRLVIPLDFDYAHYFHEGRAKVTKNGKSGFIDTAGTVVVPIEYDSASDFSEGRARVEKDGQDGYIDTTGRLVIPLDFDSAGNFQEGRARVTKNGKCGFIDTAGTVVIPIEYDDAADFLNGRARVTKNGKHGFIDTTGTIIIPLEYDFLDNSFPCYVEKDGNAYYIDITGQPVWYEPGLFYDNWIGLHKDGKEGRFDRITGRLVIPIEYDVIYPLSEGLCAVKKDEAWGYVDAVGDIVIPLELEYEEVGSFTEGLAWVRRDRKYGYIDTTGRLVTPLDFDYARHFQEGLARVGKNGKDGFIDTTGTVVIPIEYDNASDFSEGLACVEKDGKYGYVDATGRLIIPLDFDDADSFYGGLARVGQYGEYGLKYGFIDMTGRIVIPMEYDDTMYVHNGLDMLYVLVEKGSSFGFYTIEKDR